MLVGETGVICIGPDLEQPLDATAPGRCDGPALIPSVSWRMNRWRVPRSIRQLCCSDILPVTNRVLGRVTADRLGIDPRASYRVGIVLLSLDVRLDIRRRHQTHGVAKCPKLARQ